MKPEVCARCGQEVRFGTREGVTGWLHRESVDHETILGQMVTPEMRAEVERQMDLPRTRTVTRSKKKDGEIVTWTEEQVYTTRELDLERYRKSKKFREAEALEGDDEDDIVIIELPEPEIACHPLEPDSFPPRSGIRQIINLLPKHDWVLRRLTGARGPYLGADGSVLSISDSVVLGASGPERLDGTTRIAVASWRDGKFDSAYTGILKDGHLSTTGVNATQLKAWIKGTDEQPD